jgi:hypothetical protein
LGGFGDFTISFEEEQAPTAVDRIRRLGTMREVHF